MVRPETWKLGRPRMPSALFADSVARLAGDDRGVGDLLHQPGAEHWSRDAEDHVVIGHFGREVRLLHRAGRCRAGTSVDREQRVDAPVRRAVVIPHEAGLSYRPVDERNEGTASVPPLRLANAIWGLTAGLDPPTAGCA